MKPPTDVLLDRVTRGSGRRFGVVLILTLFVLLLLPADAGAHAFLDRSDPEANSVVPTTPDQVQMWFTEPLEVSYTSAQLYDVHGGLVDTPESMIDPNDPNSLILPLPDELPTGTYTVAWRNISTVDGHPSEGFFAFTIGSEADVRVPAAPSAPEFGGLPTFLEAVGRWLVVMGLMGTLGMLVTAFWVLPRGLASLESPLRNRIWNRLRRVILGVLGATIVGGSIGLVNQTLTVESDFSSVAVFELLLNSGFGEIWLGRIASTVLLILAVLVVSEDYDRAVRSDRWLTTPFAVIPLVTVALNSHSAAIRGGWGAAVLADLAHLVAGSLWVGGLVALGLTLVLTRQVAMRRRRMMLVSVIFRFSTLAISSVVVLVLTGIYVSWLHVGNLTALLETDHGRVLLIKLAVAAVMLALGAINLLVFEPRLRSAAERGVHFGRTVMAEAGLGIVVLLLVGVLTSLPTARGELESQSGRLAADFSENGVNATLSITPGSVGINRYTADFASDDVSASSTVLLRITPESDDVSGTQEVELEHVEGTRFEARGSDLSVVGEWQLELILRQSGTTDRRATTSVSLLETPPEQSTPGHAPRFQGAGGAVSSLAVLAGMPLVVAGSRRGRHRPLLAIGMLLLLFGSIGLLGTIGYP